MARRVDAAATGVGAVSAAVLAATWVAAQGGDVASWEVTLSRWAVDLHGGLTPVLEVVMQAGTRVAPLVVAVVAAAVAGWRWRAAGVAAAGWLAWAVAQWAKDAVDRPRPPGSTVEGPGYPSTHTAVAAAVAVAVLLLLPRRSLPAIAALTAVPALTALARLHLGVHWGLDVVGGAAIGTLVASLTALAVGDHR